MLWAPAAEPRAASKLKAWLRAAPSPARRVGYVAGLSWEPGSCMPFVPATLSQLDCLVMAPHMLQPEPPLLPAQPVAARGALAAVNAAVVTALNAGGSVLIPVFATGERPRHRASVARPAYCHATGAV